METLDSVLFHGDDLLTPLRNSKIPDFFVFFTSVFPSWCLSLCIATKEPGFRTPFQRQGGHIITLYLCKITPVEIQMCLVQFLVYFFF